MGSNHEKMEVENLVTHSLSRDNAQNVTMSTKEMLMVHSLVIMFSNVA